MPKYQTLINGVPTGVDSGGTGGATDANKIPNLDANGRITALMLPNGIGVDVVGVTASEAIAAGDYVNVYSNAGAFAVRKADGASPAKYANGYVLAAVASAASAQVYTDDQNDQVTGQTAGDVFLSVTVPGKTQAAAPTVAGQVSQKLGFAVSATLIKVKIDQHYVV